MIVVIEPWQFIAYRARRNQTYVAICSKRSACNEKKSFEKAHKLYITNYNLHDHDDQQLYAVCELNPAVRSAKFLSLWAH